MEESGRRAQATTVAAAAVKKKKKKQTTKTNEATMLREHPRHRVPFAEIPGITGVLRDRLEALGATEPSFMAGKSLMMSDVNQEQARLLFSCKRESLSQSPVTAVFTKTEMQFVADKTAATGGLLVTAFDRAGRSYDLTCRYLTSNAGYRFITGWKPFVIDNGLGVAMRVELWWFRSRKLHNRYELRQGEDGKEKKVPATVETGHPDGSLGLVLLHYDNDDLLEPEQGAANEAPPVQEIEDNLKPEQAAVDEFEPNEPKQAVAVDDGGTCAEPIKSKTATIAEDKLADGGSDECAEPMIRERNNMISRADVFNAAIGLLELRKYYSGGGGGGGGGGGKGEPGS